MKNIKYKQQQQWGWAQFISTLKAFFNGICDVHCPHAEHSLLPYLSLINILFTTPPDIDLTPKISGLFFFYPHTPSFT